MAKFLAVGTFALAIAGLPASAALAQQPEAQPQASAQNAAQVPGPRPSSPPLPNRFNELTPKWLTMRGEFRDRMEGGTNIAYTPGTGRLYWLNRFRFDVNVKPSPAFRRAGPGAGRARRGERRRLDHGAVQEPVRPAAGLR